MTLAPTTAVLPISPQARPPARDAACADLFHLLAELPAADPRRASIRDRIVELCIPLVRSVAAQYRDRGEPYEDLLQAGAIGLVKAIDRFDPGRGLQFTTYAVPTVRGEIRRHFRDHSWAVHVPRGLQEEVLLVTRASTDLVQQLGRAPTVAELVAYTRLPEESVLEALECGRSYASRSLNEPIGDADGSELLDTLGGDDPALTGVVLHESLRPALAQLPARELRIVQLRFYGNQSQSEIGRQLGISQMHVSRLLARALATLRQALTD